MGNELAESTALERSTGVTNALVLIQTAIERNIDAEQLGKLLDLQERWEANRAAQAFADAITGFQSECPPVRKSRQAKAAGRFGGYQFASYDDVMRVAGPLLAKHKIVVTYSFTSVERGMTVTCHVRVGTHVEDTTLTLPIPEMSANDTQKGGGATAYLKRYSVCAALNIVVTDEDDDAANLSPVKGNDSHELTNLFLDCVESGAIKDPKRFLSFVAKMANVPSLDRIGDVPHATFGRVKAELDRLKAKGVKS